jgi:regulator of PEP synthase PpsR (kinase-PPPase family)
VISDATGATAERVVRATLAQFGEQDVEVEVVGAVKTAEQIRAAVERTRKRKGLIAYTLVDAAMRNEIASLANEAGVDTVDLMGPLMASLSRFLTAEPARMPGLFKQPGEEHYSRLDAIGFAVAHDDGQSPHELSAADLVIAGPSRTSKTPLSVYLAYERGLKVANVPLALGLEPLAQLRELPPRNVVGLTMNPHLLARIRVARLEQMGNPRIEYAGVEHVKRELQHCHDIYRRCHWAVVDVTGKSIEEVAASICALLAVP